MKKIKKKKKYKIKEGKLKNKEFEMIELDSGVITPRDITFPIGEPQNFAIDDLEEVKK